MTSPALVDAANDINCSFQFSLFSWLSRQSVGSAVPSYNAFICLGGCILCVYDSVCVTVCVCV